MAETTWAQVHVGDTVRGADQRAWTVVGRGPELAWVVRGRHARFRLRLGDREVSTERRLVDPAPLIARADHGPGMRAVNMFPEQGLAILEESIVDYVLAGTDWPPLAQPAAPANGGIKRDRWGRYLLPDPQTGQERAWTRVTTLARTLADEYGLGQWAKRMVAKGIATRPDLAAGAAAADPEADKKTLDGLAEQAMQAAGSKSGANMGTAFHQAAARLDSGTPLAELRVPPPLDADLREYAAALRHERITVLPEYMERIVICPELGCAGTLDRIVRQPPGLAKARPLSVMDLKSAKDLSYSWLEIAVQQAVYARSTHMWNPAQRRFEPMPDELDRDRALVVWCPIGRASATIYGVDLIKGWAYAQIAAQVRAARKETLSWLVRNDPATLALHNVSRASSRAELAMLWEQLHPQGLWSEEVDAAARRRLSEVAG